MERSFKKEVELLKLGAGQVFHGEGILAVTKALLQSGVSYVGGYQGAPVSHLMDVLADSRDILDTLGVHFEPNASEAGARAMLGASINYPLRGAVTFKSTVGTNVASDALSNLASAGVRGGTLLVLGEDYGEGASIIQERTHAFAMKSQMWLLDPRPNLTTIVNMVEQGFNLSEASNTPVLLELRIRACHVHGSFVCKDNRAPAISRNALLSDPDFDYGRICLPPSTYAQEKQKVDVRWPAAVRYIREHKLNEVFDGRPGRNRHHPARRDVQRDGARAAATGLCRRVRQEPGAALCAQRHVSVDPRGDLRVLRGQARGAGGRGRTAQLPRGSDARGTAPRRSADQGVRQGRAADGRRIHRRSRRHRRGAFSGECRAARLRSGAGACGHSRDHGAEKAGRGAAEGCRTHPSARILHRLPRTAGVLRDEAARARDRRVPRLGRHRLPYLRDVAAVQSGQHRAGIRTRPRQFVGGRADVRQARRHR